MTEEWLEMQRHKPTTTAELPGGKAVLLHAALKTR